MDQVRTALNWLKRQHFWVLSVIVALIGVGCWWSASGQLRAMFEKNQSAIKGAFTILTTAGSTPFLANQSIIDRQEEERKKQVKSVTDLWQVLYDRQREAVLKWPAELKKDFADAVEKLQFNDPIPQELRNRYQNYIDRHFPELPKQINARIEAAATNGPGGEGRGGAGGFGQEGGFGAGAQLVEDNDYICLWYDQVYVREQLNFPERPSSLRIWVTQEDLWVYHALLEVIAETNKKAGATRMSNAPVKIVARLEVGQRAAASSRQKGHLIMAPAVAAAVPGAEGEAAPGAPSPRGEMGMSGGTMGGREGGPGMGGSTAMSPEQEQNFLLSGRYLDDKGMPIMVGAAASAGAEPVAPVPAADPSAPAPVLDLAQFGVGYKRLPVRMVLQMDGRWLPFLITTCANQPLRIEVQEVRINPAEFANIESSAGSAGAGEGGGGFRGGFGGGERGGFGGGGAQANPFGDETGLQYFPAQPHVINVVVQGTIYIFNKPNMTLLEAPPASTGAPVAVTP